MYPVSPMHCDTRIQYAILWNEYIVFEQCLNSCSTHILLNVASYYYIQCVANGRDVTVALTLLCISTLTRHHFASTRVHSDQCWAERD